MNLLEAAKAVLGAIDRRVVFESATEALRTAIAAEEGKPANRSDWAEFLEEARLKAVAERDELRAKLAAMESAEPVAYSFDDGRYRWLSHSQPVKGSEEEKAQWIPLYTHPAPLPAMEEREPWFCHGCSEEVFTEVHDKCGTSIMRRKAWLPAYVPMTEGEMNGVWDVASSKRDLDGIPFIDISSGRRAIERAVLARLGVKS